MNTKKVRYYRVHDRDTGKASVISAHHRYQMIEHLASMRFDISPANTDEVLALIEDGAELVELAKKMNANLEENSNGKV